MGACFSEDMQTPRFLALALLATALLLGCAKHSGGQTGDEDALPSGDELYSELARRMGSGNYKPATGVQELTEWSDRVVVARAQALRPGRTYVIGTGAKDDQRDEMHTAVLELAVERSLKGDDDDALYVEFIVGSAEAGAPSKLPTAQVMVFAKSLAGEDFAPTRIEHDGRGLPAGQMLYRLTTPQGFRTFNADGAASSPFEPGDMIFGSSDLDELIERVEDAVAFLEGDGGTAGSGGSAAGSGGAVSGRGGAGGAGGTAGSAGSAAGAGGTAGSGPLAGSGGSDIGCTGERAGSPGANPAPCPDSCAAIRGLPWDSDAMCVDYGSGIIIGCLEGQPPPSTACVESGDGQKYFVPSAWPFPMSTTWKVCDDAEGNEVITGTSCE